MYFLLHGDRYYSYLGVLSLVQVLGLKLKCNFSCVVLGVISVRDPSLLDRETQSSLMVQLIATDGGTNPRVATLLITVELEDINDNTPMFSQSVYTANVREVRSPPHLTSLLDSCHCINSSDYLCRGSWRVALWR